MPHRKLIPDLPTYDKQVAEQFIAAVKKAAAAVVILVVGTLTSTYVGTRAGRDHVFSEIADLHVATLASSSPVDVISSDRHTVKPWFQGKIPFAFDLPELQNSDFSLLGGRMT